MTEHTTHYEDCGCLSKRFAERIAELERDNRNMHSLNDGMRETVAELEANAEELMAEVKMYGAANGELKDALDEALTELAATMNALSAAHEALTSAESCIVALEKRVQQAETELAVADDRYKAMVKNVAGYEATIEAMRGQYTDLMIENKQLQSFIIHDGVARPYSVKALQETLQQAEAELAALKGRRCEGCRYWLANGCPQIGGWHPADFSCSEWQPLPETRP